jgi:S-adenosylmethionine decarboxylase
MKEKIHEFTGKHLMVNYMNCERAALLDIKKLELIMKEAASASKASVLNSIMHTFPIKNSDMIGMSTVLILSESHASIHTYPEYDACFVDFFTCGNDCKAENFDKIMRDFLKPKQVISKLYLRDENLIGHVKMPDPDLDLCKSKKAIPIA